MAEVRCGLYLYDQFLDVVLNQYLIDSLLNPNIPSGLFYLNSLDRLISYIGGV